ncbi:MAG TPA: NADP-dependent oxidoreductase [Streptosporangiaceae bacterium]|nr:NADP-dependent oxidoreductase [Streptosporangiaceae bacterium]
MRAIVVDEFDGTPHLADVPVPEPGAGDIQIQIKAAGINPFDAAIVRGALRDYMPHKFPLVLGMDGAGVVTAAGPGVAAFQPGDRVYGQFHRPPAGLGTYAEYSLASVDGVVAKMPDGVNFEQAAALPVATTTGWNLVRAANVDMGQTVLVVGATGGVGQAALQFAAAQGATVIATAPPDAVTLVTGLGATATVDHTAGALADQVLSAYPDGLDAVIDTVGGRQAMGLARAIKTGGVLISAKGAADSDTLAEREIRGINFVNQTDGAQLGELAALVDAGRVKVILDHIVPLADAPAALERLLQGGSRGKTVIRL